MAVVEEVSLSKRGANKGRDESRGGRLREVCSGGEVRNVVCLRTSEGEKGKKEGIGGEERTAQMKERGVKV